MHTKSTLRSPRYNYTIPAGALLAGGMWFKDFAADNKTANEVPFNNIIVRNFSSQRLRVSYGDSVWIVGGSELLNDSTAYGLTNLKIQNLDGTAPTNDLIFIVVWRQVDASAAMLAKIIPELSGVQLAEMFSIANGNGGA